MSLYLLGIFMGALDTGIVTPARTIIQNDLGVDDQTGIWMITGYTLAYAASIPVMGKLADRYGRKPIYLTAILLFGVGSLLCGLAQDTGSFGFLIAARAIQAVGGGGILPIATAEFGTEVPVEKRGMALGLVGAVFGIANIFGSSVGSLILDLVGPQNWQWIFYVNVPIAVAIIAGGLIVLPNHRSTVTAPLDLVGITLLVGMILSLLLGLRNLDYFDLSRSLASMEVYPYLVAFAVLVPLFLLAERRAADPVTNLGFFRSRPIVITLAIAFLSGFTLMGTVFVPQFSENALSIPTGKGGYFVIVLGIASGIGAPLSGRLTDTMGPRRVLGFGLAASVVGCLVLIGWAIPAPSLASVLVSLALLGLGLGFSVGSPLNYMMLEQTRPGEANSALATLSLVRSIGTTIAPAIMVGFLAHAGTQLQESVVTVLPTQIAGPRLPYADELQDSLEAMRSDERLKDRLGDLELPDLTDRTTITIDLDGGGSLPPDLVELLRTADVTTITDRTKTVASRMFDLTTPDTIADITSGAQRGVDALGSAVAELDDGVATMDRDLASMSSALREQAVGIRKLTSGITGQTKAINGMTSGIAGMTKAAAGMLSGIAGLTSAIDGARAGLDGLTTFQDVITPLVPDDWTGTSDLTTLLPPPVLAQLPPQVLKELAGITTLAELQTRIDRLAASVDALLDERAALRKDLPALEIKLALTRASRAKLIAARASLTSARTKLVAAHKKLGDAREALTAARGDLVEARAEVRVSLGQLEALRDAVPGAFEQSRNDYLAEIERRRPELERAFAATLNTGFLGVYLTTAAACLLALGLLLAYPARRREAAMADAPGPRETALV